VKNHYLLFEFKKDLKGRDPEENSRVHLGKQNKSKLEWSLGFFEVQVGIDPKVWSATCEHSLVRAQDPGTLRPPAPVRLTGSTFGVGRGLRSRYPEVRRRSPTKRGQGRPSRYLLGSTPRVGVVVTRLSLVPPWRRWGQGLRLLTTPPDPRVWSGKPLIPSVIRVDLGPCVVRVGVQS